MAVGTKAEVMVADTGVIKVISIAVEVKVVDTTAAIKVISIVVEVKVVDVATIKVINIVTVDNLVDLPLVKIHNLVIIDIRVKKHPQVTLSVADSSLVELRLLLNPEVTDIAAKVAWLC